MVQRLWLFLCVLAASVLSDLPPSTTMAAPASHAHAASMSRRLHSKHKDDEDTDPPRRRGKTKKSKTETRPPLQGSLAAMDTPDVFTTDDEKALKKYMKTHHNVARSRAMSADAEEAAISQSQFDTAATESYGVCDPTLHLTACLQRGTGLTVPCMTKTNATNGGACAITFVREKDPGKANHDEKFYTLAAADGDIPGLAVQSLEETLVVQSVPASRHMDFSNMKSFVMENLALPEGVHTLRLANLQLNGYPAKGCRNITLPSTMRRIALRMNRLKTFDPSNWANVPLQDMCVVNFLENNLLSDLGNVTFPPSVTTLNLRNNVIRAFSGTTLPTSLRILRLGNNHIPSVEAVPMTNLTQLVTLELRENKNITMLTKATGDALPSTLTNLDFSLCSISRIDADFKLPHNLTVLKLRHNNLTSIFNLTLPTSLGEFTLEGNDLIDARITHANFDVLRRSLRSPSKGTTYATAPPQCRPGIERSMAIHSLVVCVVLDPSNPVDQAVVLGGAQASTVVALGHSTFVSTVLPILLSAIGGAALVAVAFVAIYRRRQRYDHGAAAMAHKSALSGTVLLNTASRVSYVEYSSSSVNASLMELNPRHDRRFVSSSVAPSSFDPSVDSLVTAEYDSDPPTSASAALTSSISCDMESCPSSLHAWMSWVIPPRDVQDVDRRATKVYVNTVDPNDDQVYTTMASLVGVCHGRRVTLVAAATDAADALLATLTTIHHPHVVPFFGVTWTDHGDDASLLLVFESVGGGTLRAPLLLDHVCPPTQKFAIAFAVADVLTYLHGHGVGRPYSHLSVDAILLDVHGQVKLNLLHNKETNEVWTAPEHRDDAPTAAASLEADVYAFGILLATLDREAVPDLSDQDPLLWFTPGCPASIRDVGLRCVQEDPRQRPSMAEVMTVLTEFAHDGESSAAASTVSTTDTFNH
ncbi:Aste57867_23048 [Aphanomyces stellatus]|uniref:Aste57867_23048 protein n=1 Tax=Aphanomyces stellatus TaxID=120398 RepID=A0A485LM61_9STRA|nr:hypothetical protein As57867_022977 [Aphanomyces stellatus]VFT99696.1 Aste57867_23048 [Aphanomyces stellatus]